MAPPTCFPPGEFEWSWKRATKKRREGHDLIRLWSWQPRTVDPSFVERMLYYIIFAFHALVWAFLRRDEFDVVLTSSPPIFTGLVAFPLSITGSAKWVLDIRDLWIDVSSDLGFISGDGIATRLSRRYQEQALKRADLVTITTPGTEARMREHYSFETAVQVIPNGVDTQYFEPQDEPQTADLIYTGNIGYGQDLETCIRALPLLENSDVTFTLVGDGDLRPELTALAERLGVTDRVEFTGLVPRDEIPRLLNGATIGVAPLKARESLSYAVPTKVYEYLACKLPVLALGNGEIERVVEASEGGVIPDGSPQSVADAIDELLDDERRRRRMATRGRQFVVSNYDRQAIAAELFDAISKLVEPANWPVSERRARSRS